MQDASVTGPTSPCPTTSHRPPGFPLYLSGLHNCRYIVVL